MRDPAVIVDAGKVDGHGVDKRRRGKPPAPVWNAVLARCEIGHRCMICGGAENRGLPDRLRRRLDYDKLRPSEKWQPHTTGGALLLDFLQLVQKTILVFGGANKKSVAYHVGRLLTEAGARVF